MSKEGTKGVECACGQRIAFPEFHWPHCSKNPDNMSATVKKNLPFTKAQLADIAHFGPQPDKPISRGRGRSAR